MLRRRHRFSCVCVVLLVLAARWGSHRTSGENDAEAVRAHMVEVKFVQDRVELVSRREGEAFVPRQYGTPQLAEMFYEVTGAKGQVMYSATLVDPRYVGCGQEGDPAQGTGGTMERLDEAVTELRLPASGGPVAVTIYRRVAGTGNEKPRRTVVLKVDL